MSALFKKLNLGVHRLIHILHAPPSFEGELAALTDVEVKRKAVGRVHLAMAFVITQAELDAASAALAKVADGDAILWMVYPKKSSKKYACEFNRDTGWHVLGAAGFEPVRAVAVDDDWSALRFRRAEFIKTMTRDAAMTISDAGKQKASALKTARTSRPSR
ncbi:MAG: hypothetical protein IT353_13760 [Gemmatimonadaceae bacterium]|nr:hypothetical protein [Gemmatimonadaceae bacterium]